MNETRSNGTIDRISGIIGNAYLADALFKSISVALNSSKVHIKGGKDHWTVFESSLNSAIRDIKTHPLGKLFRRFIEYGPHNPEDPAAPSSDGETILSDLECAKAVEFIYSHMINRFKGELAELLAIKPLVKFSKQLQLSGQLSSHVELFLGDTIREKRRRISEGNPKVEWTGYAKGADGLVINSLSDKTKSDGKKLWVCGVIEVKSMYKSPSILEKQLIKHMNRLAGGVFLNGTEWKAEDVILRSFGGKKSTPLFISVIPANWKINRMFSWEQQGDKSVMHFPDPSKPPDDDVVEKNGQNGWRIKLAWSQEALDQAAYEMTFWYMSQVGQAIYSVKQKPKGCEEMSPGEAGYNAIKMMLYYVPLRIKHMHPPKKDRFKIKKFREQIDDKATRLYNVYSFGYPLGVDSKEMLWPEDFQHSN